MRVFLTVVTVLACVLPAGPVAAAPSVTWGVAPSSRSGPDGRAAFNYKLDPGAELTDYAGISNYSGQPITVDVYASDAFTTPSGGFDLLPAAERPVDVGSWVTFEPRHRRLVIPSKSRVDVPFRVSVPRNATPGDHPGGIVASMAEPGTGAEGNRVRVDRRVGARVYLRVTGELAPAFTVERLDTSWAGTLNPFAGGTMTATYRVRNTGNVRLTGTPRVEVAGPFGLGRRTADAPPLPEILPGDEYTATVRVRGVAPLVRLGVDLDLAPQPVNATVPAPATSAHRAVWAWPWPQAALLLLCAGAVWLLLHRRRARARHPVAARSEGRAAPEPPDVKPTR